MQASHAPTPAWKGRLFAGVSLALVALPIFLPPVHDLPKYQEFVDGREWLGIPNAQNTLSNLLFVLCGALGLFQVRRRWQAEPSIRLFAPFFAAVILTGFGSAYFHWAPSTARLFWDRLPMTLAFMSLMAAMVSERISPKAGRILLGPLLLLGLWSVLYWRWTESQAPGQGDLRYYAVVQYGPMLLLPLLVVLFRSRFTRTRDLIWLFAAYLVAKAFELSDAAVFEATARLVSGHALKHAFAAAGTGVLAWHLGRRARIS